MGMRLNAAGAPLMLLIGCQSPSGSVSGPVAVPGHPGTLYSAPARLSGMLVTGFEVFSFDDCWLDMSREASAQFRRLAPEAGGRGPFYFRAVVIGRTAPPGQYGHLGAYRCQIQVSRFITLDRVRRPSAR